MRVLHAGDDVLPAIRAQQQGPNAGFFVARETAARDAQEVGGVGRRLRLQDAVDGGHEVDQVRDGLLLLAQRQAAFSRTHSSSSSIACCTSSTQWYLNTSFQSGEMSSCGSMLCW